MTHIKGYYDTKDAGILHEKGYISVLSRSDDVISVAGHRLSAAAIEEVSRFVFAFLEIILVVACFKWGHFCGLHACEISFMVALLKWASNLIVFIFTAIKCFEVGYALH